MTPEERDLITGLFSRLKAADTPNKDRDAEELIRSSSAAFPAAPYLLTQTVLVQEQALKSAENHIAKLEQDLAEARRGTQAQPSSGGFLNRIRRPWETPATPQQSAPPAYAQPSYAQPAYAPPSSGGGFLHSALSTAAGVAGGALLFSGIERMLGYHPGPFAGYGGFGTMGSPWGASTPVENVTVNNYYDGNNDSGTGTDVSDSGGQYADYQDDNSDFGGGGDSFDV